MFMDEGMDTGDILLTEKTTIGDNETTGELWQRLSIIGANLLVKTLSELEKGNLEPRKQAEEFTLAPMIEKEMAHIDWQTKNSIEIKNLVRGLNPIMGTYSFLDDKKIKFWKVDVISNESNANPGEVILADSKQGLHIKTVDGAISVFEIQGENSKKMNILDYLRGNSIQVGAKFN